MGKEIERGRRRTEKHAVVRRKRIGKLRGAFEEWDLYYKMILRAAFTHVFASHLNMHAFPFPYRSACC